MGTAYILTLATGVAIGNLFMGRFFTFGTWKAGLGSGVLAFLLTFIMGKMFLK